MAAIVGIGIAAAILFLIIGAALLTWGILGTFLVAGGILAIVGWIVDRRRQAQYDALD